MLLIFVSFKKMTKQLSFSIVAEVVIVVRKWAASSHNDFLNTYAIIPELITAYF